MAGATARKLFRIQYVSDLHLEFYDKAVFPLLVKPCARVLALAGDIGQPHQKTFQSFMEYTSRHWDHVFYVAGNHEYYNARKESMSEIQKSICNILAPYKNIHYLSPANPYFYFPDENIAIVGTTLWTHIPEEMHKDAATFMNDFRRIYREPSVTLTPAEISNIHKSEYDMLETQIDYWERRGANIVVLTHHMPSFRLISPRFAGHPLNCCFATPCEPLFRNFVRAWIYGHTHNASTGIVGSRTIAAVNARGYPDECVPGFMTEAWLEFPYTPDEYNEIYPEVRDAAADLT